MRVAIDIRRIGEFGVGTYIWNLVRNIAALDEHGEYLAIGTERNFSELGALPSNFGRICEPDQPSLWGNLCTLPMALRREKVDLLHVPHHDPPAFSPVKLLVTVHDCAHLRYPDESSSKLQNYRQYWKTRRTITRSSHVITVSNSTRQDLVNIFNIDNSKVSVIHNALDGRFALNPTVEDRERVLERYQIKDPFILYSGRIRPHKNIHRLIEAFAVLKSELADHDYYRNLKLIVIGDELSKHQYLRLTVVRGGVQQDVRFFGFVPYPVLWAFYRSAAMFAFPSLYEGFGLPPLEAMANRTPVLASNTSSLPEVLEDAALLVNPENVFEIARGMKWILLDDELRRKLIDRGIEQVAKFSWKVAAKRVISTYRQTCSKRPVDGRKAATPDVNEEPAGPVGSADSPAKRLRI